MRADRGRVAVYAAEEAAFEGTDLEAVVALDLVVGLGTRLVATDWWPGPDVTVRPARADARSSRCAWRTGVTTITIAAPQATVATLAHELAHALAGAHTAHGPGFRRAHLDVVAAITNLERLGVRTDPDLPDLARRGALHVDQLAAALGAAGLTVGERSWPPPPDVAGPIAL